jgi:hypothetical protein
MHFRSIWTLARMIEPLFWRLLPEELRVWDGVLGWRRCADGGLP